MFTEAPYDEVGQNTDEETAAHTGEDQNGKDHPELELEAVFFDSGNKITATEGAGFVQAEQ